MPPCAFCVVRCVCCSLCVVCVVGVQEVGVGVGVSRWTPLSSPSPPSLPHTPLLVCTFKTPPSPRVHIQNVPVCTGTTPARVTTCGQSAGTHGGRFECTHGGFQRATPHHTPHTTHTTTTTTHTRHNNNHHNNTRGQGQTERQRKKTEKERQDKTRQDKTRQDKTRQDKTRQDKTRQDKTRQDKTRQDKTRQDKTRQDKTRQDKTRQDERRREKMKKERQDKTRQEKREERREKREERREKREERREKRAETRDKRQETRDKRQDDRENEREDQRWKKRQDEKEWTREKMKEKIKGPRENEEREMKRVFFFFFWKCLSTPKSARWISPKSFKSSESDRSFNYLHDSNSIFRPGWIKSENVFRPHSTLCREHLENEAAQARQCDMVQRNRRPNNVYSSYSQEAVHLPVNWSHRHAHLGQAEDVLKKKIIETQPTSMESIATMTCCTGQFIPRNSSVSTEQSQSGEEQNSGEASISPYNGEILPSDRERKSLSYNYSWRWRMAKANFDVQRIYSAQKPRGFKVIHIDWCR